MVRLFVALELPDDVRERLAILAGGVPGARWTAPESLHLTLRFIGEVEEHRLCEADAALGFVEVEPFPLTLSGVGQFGSGGRPRSLWVGVAECPALFQLQARVASALARAGLPADERKFSPHITLARLRDTPIERIGRYIAANNLVRIGPFVVSRFALFESVRSRSGGSHYQLLRHYPEPQLGDAEYDDSGYEYPRGEDSRREDSRREDSGPDVADQRGGASDRGHEADGWGEPEGH